MAWEMKNIRRLLSRYGANWVDLANVSGPSLLSRRMDHPAEFSNTSVHPPCRHRLSQASIRGAGREDDMDLLLEALADQTAKAKRRASKGRPAKLENFGEELLPLSVFQNKNRVLKVKGDCLERTQDIQSDHAVCVPELEVADHNIPPEGAMLFFDCR